ncbi:aldehyde ferredoxin oxidoreductase family protein [Halobium salinum]|uniref:Aldehyde ferredoxin oxidoreductase family protein n=1 Tax=Halobium salinum TaxID=1364940 RepID=A0ABD5PCT3_9EURY|nr:aldehyde ferredoxin oxidoreductase C-terminal domain-containing protein [Halobium salinum]
MTDDTPPGGLLRVDLTAGTAEREPIPERWRRQYVGGKGLGARYLYDELEPGTDPLGPDNVLLFSLGPVTGLTPGHATDAVVTKSPLTGTFLDSYAGGDFPARLAGALGDCLAVLVEGESEDPVALHVADGEATLEPATDLWGLDAVETTDRLLADAPDADRRAVACIGPAGENRVRYATVASDGGDHQAGRGGAGAVLGAKRLKAVVVDGDDRADTHADTDFAGRDDSPDRDGLDALRREYDRRLAETDSGRWYGAGETMETVDFAAETGVLPTRGWSGDGTAGGDGGETDPAADLGIEAVRAAAVARERADDAVPGGFRVEADDGAEPVPRGATPISLGSNLDLADFDAVAALGGRCDRLGLDVISAGNAVAWVMHADGVDVDFGDDEAARRLLEEIATRSTPLGDDLAEGVERAAERRGNADAVPTVKAMSLSSYDPRRSPAMALAYATSDRGACHRRARPVVEEVFAVADWSPARRAAAVAAEQDLRSALWSLVVDDLAAEAFETDLGAEWLRAVGLDYDAADLRRVGERVWNLTRLFNVREGFGRADDALPMALARSGEDVGLDPAEFEAALDAYYDRRGWDEHGVPTRSTLRRLDLSDLVDDTTPVGRSSDAAACDD